MILTRTKNDFRPKWHTHTAWLWLNQNDFSKTTIVRHCTNSLVRPKEFTWVRTYIGVGPTRPTPRMVWSRQKKLLLRYYPNHISTYVFNLNIVTFPFKFHNRLSNKKKKTTHTHTRLLRNLCMLRRFYKSNREHNECKYYSCWKQRM